MTGVVTGVLGNGIVVIAPDDSEIVEAWGLKRFYAHEKQCRRIKKRERRRVWLNPNVLPRDGMVALSIGPTKVSDLAPQPGFIEFVEVRK